MGEPFYIENSMGFLLGRSTRMMAMNLNRKFSESGYAVTVDHWIILSKLLHQGGQKQQYFAQISGHDKTAITRIIDYMEERNWVYRQPDTHDRRNKKLYLTNQGKGLQQGLVKIVQEANEEIEQQLDEQELKTCKKVLREIFGALTDHDNHYNIS